MKKNGWFILTAVILLTALLSVSAFAEGDNIFKLNYTGGDVPTIDQALSSDMIGGQIEDELTVGLMRQNEQTGSLDLGMATEYSVSDDGLTYTFKLMQNVPWVTYNTETSAVEEVKDCSGNVRMVNANDFVYGAKRTLDPATASDYAYVPAAMIAGADAFNKGTNTDFAAVGVKAIDDYTVSYTFIEPGVFNLDILSMWMLHAMPSWIIDGDTCTEGMGTKWIETGSYQGYGPFTLQEWNHNDSMTLIANPFWPGTESTPKPSLDAVHYSMLGEPEALSEYEAGNMDESPIPAGDYDRITSDPQYKDALVQKSTGVGTEWLIYNIHMAPTDDARVRLALSYAVDKDAIVKTSKSGIAARYYINPAVAGAPKEADYPDLGISYDPEKAKSLINEYCKEKGVQPSDLTVSYFYNSNDTNKIRAEALQSMWETTLGIKVELQSAEWSVYKTQRYDGKQNIFRGSWIQDYMDANNFTKDVFVCPGASYIKTTDWPSYDCADTPDATYQKYADLIGKAAKETDEKKREDLYAQADDILMKDVALYNPLVWYSSYELINPRINFTQTVTGYDHWEKWSIK